MKFVTPLLEYSPELRDSQRVGFEVFWRRSKYLLAAKCATQLHSIDAEDPQLHVMRFKLRQLLRDKPDDLKEKVASIIAGAATELVDQDAKDLTRWNEAWRSKHSQSAPHIHAYLRVRQLHDPDSQKQNEKDLIDSLSLEDMALEDAVAGLELLEEWGSSSTDYKRVAAERWKEAIVFKNSD